MGSVRVKGVWNLIITGFLGLFVLYQGFTGYTSQRVGDDEVRVEGWVSGIERVEVERRRGPTTFYVHTVTFTNPVTGELEKVASREYRGGTPSLGDSYDVFVSADGSARVAEGNAAWKGTISLVAGLLLCFALVKAVFKRAKGRTHSVDESLGAVHNDQN